MKKLIILLVVFFLSCTPLQKPNKSVPTVKTSTKSKVVKKAKNQAPIKANEGKEEIEDKEIHDKKLGYDATDNEDKEREELKKILNPKNEYTWIEKMWNAFKVNRAEDLLKDIGKGSVYRTKDSILYVIDNAELTDRTLSELAKIYLLQKGKVTIYSKLDIGNKLLVQGLPKEKITQKPRGEDNSVLKLDIEVVG